MIIKKGLDHIISTISMRLIKHFKLVPKKLIDYYAVTTLTPHETIIVVKSLIHSIIQMKIIKIFILVLVLL